ISPGSHPDAHQARVERGASRREAKLDRAIALSATKFLFIKSPTPILSKIGGFEICPQWRFSRTPGTLGGECDRMNGPHPPKTTRFHQRKIARRNWRHWKRVHSLLLNLNRKK
ncbi:hypothetical protein, partial [Phormidium sp. CCY1219]|uniref:hypothetical protein n=1 Tax=Phormidium sp. CCY1219 TaxID=2886104 RepID=UPI002D1F5F82